MNTLDWTIENLITVTLMVLVSFFAFATVAKLVSKMRGGNAAPAPAAS